MSWGVGGLISDWVLARMESQRWSGRKTRLSAGRSAGCAWRVRRLGRSSGQDCDWTTGHLGETSYVQAALFVAFRDVWRWLGGAPDRPRTPPGLGTQAYVTVVWGGRCKPSTPPGPGCVKSRCEKPTWLVWAAAGTPSASGKAATPRRAGPCSRCRQACRKEIDVTAVKRKGRP